MKIVVDMNLSPAWIDVLRGSDHSAVHWSQIGPIDEADQWIADWARTNEHVVLTADLDFGQIMALGGRASPSVVQLRCDDTRHGTVGSAVLDIITAKSADLAVGAFVTFDGARTRSRSLPL